MSTEARASLSGSPNARPHAGDRSLADQQDVPLAWPLTYKQGLPVVLGQEAQNCPIPNPHGLHSSMSTCPNITATSKNYQRPREKKGNRNFSKKME